MNTYELESWMMNFIKDKEPIQFYSVADKVLFPAYNYHSASYESCFICYLVGPISGNHAPVFAIRLNHLMSLKHQQMKIVASHTLLRMQLIKNEARLVDMNGGELGNGLDEDLKLDQFIHEGLKS